MKTYFESRTQAVSISKDGKDFSPQFITSEIGVPQGSLAGRLFMDDIFEKIYNFEPIEKHGEGLLITFAEETSMLITQKLYTDLIVSTDIYLIMVRNWVASNKMLLYCFKIIVIMARQLM